MKNKSSKTRLIIGTFSAAVVLAVGVCSSSLFVNNIKASEQSNSNNLIAGTQKVDEEKTIPYPAGYDLTTEGASSYANTGDHKDSIYYPQIDVFNMKSDDSLTILSKFKTYQQTTEVTCGPSSALMVLHHFGETNYDELEIAELAKCHKDLNGNNKEQPGVANERGEIGTSTDKMVGFFKSLGWEVTSSLTEAGEDGYTFQEYDQFKDFVIKNISEGTPIIVEWIDWAGHWADIIGYDTMGTETPADDVLILADPYDTSDHNQDGYQIYSAFRS